MNGVAAEGATPREFDITITSTTDDEKTVRQAVGLETPTPTTDDAKPGAPAVATAGAGETDDEPAKAPTPRKAKPADKPAETPAATVVPDDQIENPVPGETADQRADRIERNFQRLVKSTSAASTRETERLRLENARLQGRLEGREPAKAAAEAPVVPKFEFPSWNDYSEAHPDATHEEYADERSDARDAFRTAQASLTAAQKAAKDEADTVTAQGRAHITAFRAAVPDFDEVLAASEAPLTAHMHITMLPETWGPAVAYHLSQPAQLAEAQRIARLSPVGQVKAIERLKDDPAVTALMALLTPRSTTKSAAAGAPAKDPDEEEDEIVQPASRRTSRAPSPLPVVAGGAQGAEELANLSTDAYVRRRDDEDKRRGRRR